MLVCLGRANPAGRTEERILSPVEPVSTSMPPTVAQLLALPLGARVIALCDRLITNLRYPVHYACLLLLLITLPHHPLSLLRLIIVVGVVSAVNMLYYLRSERSPEFFYGILYAYYFLFTLFWIFPVAVFTVRSKAWLTR